MILYVLRISLCVTSPLRHAQKCSICPKQNVATKLQVKYLLQGTHRENTLK